MLKCGDCFSKTVTATEQCIQQIALVSGDVNPVHLDAEYAKRTIFGRKIAHGLFLINTISAIIGNDLPGNGSILMSQKFRYCKPVYIGDTIETKVIVAEILPKGKYLLHIVCKNQEDKIVLDGETLVKWDG